MAIQSADHPAMQVFAIIRLIDHGRREQTAECLPAGLGIKPTKWRRALPLSTLAMAARADAALRSAASDCT